MERRRIKFDFLIHDLKVPLAVVEAGVVSLLEKQDKYGTLNEKQKKVLFRVLRNTKVTQHIVNDALELGRSNNGIVNKTKFIVSDFIEHTLVEIFDLTDYSVAEMIKGCVHLADLKNGLKTKGILLSIDDQIWKQELFVDQSKLRQILRNLLNNALKYRHETIEIQFEKNGEALFISVSDDGQGIPREYHQKIFECYFQMDAQQSHCVRGHGLGLAGVMVLLEDMGGELLLDSDTGKGARFNVKIPYKP